MHAIYRIELKKMPKGKPTSFKTAKQSKGKTSSPAPSTTPIPGSAVPSTTTSMPPPSTRQSPRLQALRGNEKPGGTGRVVSQLASQFDAKDKRTTNEEDPNEEHQEMGDSCTTKADKNQGKLQNKKKMKRMPRRHQCLLHRAGSLPGSRHSKAIKICKERLVWCRN